ncbi:hypothetical protein BH11ARM1_BH11ARM1_17730 [soil metagenome]
MITFTYKVGDSKKSTYDFSFLLDVDLDVALS